MSDEKKSNEADLPTMAEIKEVLQKVELAHTELFAELGNKRAGDWGKINDGLVAFGTLRRRLESQ